MWPKPSLQALNIPDQEKWLVDEWIIFTALEYMELLRM